MIPKLLHHTVLLCLATTSALAAVPSSSPSTASNAKSAAPAAFHAWAATPPMGWNSWDCFATTVTEAQTREQAAFMADKLKAHGWQYVVVDIQWYEPGAKDHGYRKDAVLVMDGYGRLQPALNRFPSSADGAGFRPLADQIHSLGLKFGIHLMRGIPRQAVEKNLPILGTSLRAADIADKVHVCPWNPDMYGVDMSKPGAQEYYDSVFALIASWGVDYVKVDDLSRPYFQNQPEVEAIRRAIDKTGRPMVLSLSPGATDLRAASHVVSHANLWRISDDFWDRWLALREQFGRLAAWNAHRRPGAWPDADMLPLGSLVMGERTTRFTRDEQLTLMTLWSIARSPLMHGGDLTKTDDFTLSLLTNDEVLAVNQHSTDNRLHLDADGLVAWTARDPETGDSYLAVFNTRDRVRLDASNAPQAPVVVSRAPGSVAEIDTDLSGGRRLFLVADPVEETDGFTPIRWQNPRFVMADGGERLLADLNWVHADAQWDSAHWTKPGPDGQRHLVAQAAAVIEYAIPEGARRFLASAVVDRGEHAAAAATEGGNVRVTTVVGTERNEDGGPGLPVPVSLASLGFKGPVRVRDLWARSDLGEQSGVFQPVVPFHGARLFRLSRTKADGRQ